MMRIKTSFVFFFLSCVLLIGCSGNFNYPSHRITIYKTDSTKKEYDLLSVRGDSTVVVLDWKEAKVKPIPFSHVELIKRDSIMKIERDGHGGWVRSMFLGAIIGLAVGEVIEIGPAVLLGGSAPLFAAGSTGSSSQVSPKANVVIGALSFAGAVIGGGIGIAFPPSKQPQLTSDSDRFFLRSIALYPDKEPGEMKYIK